MIILLVECNQWVWYQANKQLSVNNFKLMSSQQTANISTTRYTTLNHLWQRFWIKQKYFVNLNFSYRDQNLVLADDNILPLSSLSVILIILGKAVFQKEHYNSSPAISHQFHNFTKFTALQNKYAIIESHLYITAEHNALLTYAQKSSFKSLKSFK